MNVQDRKMDGSPGQVVRSGISAIHLLFPFIFGPQTVSEKLLAKCNVMSAKANHPRLSIAGSMTVVFRTGDIPVAVV